MRKLKPSFDDYEVEPSPQVWMKIESRLDDVPSNRKGWLFFSVAAAVVAAVLFFTVFYDIEINVKPKQREAGNGPVKGSGPTEISTSKHIDKTVSTTEEGTTVFANKTGINANKSVKKATAKNKGEKKTSTFSLGHSLSSSTQKRDSDGKLQASHHDLIFASAESEPTVEKINLIGSIIPTPEDELTLTTTYSNEAADYSRPKVSLSRWEASLGATYEYNYRIINYASRMPITQKEKEYFKNEKGIHTFSYSAGISYNLSGHYSIISGISYISAGQERDQSEITQKATVPTVKANSYSVNSSTGNVLNSSQDLNNVYYSSLDSAIPLSYANPGNIPAVVNSALATFKFRQQFYFLSIPFLIRYQTAEHRLTPYIGLGFSLDYLVKEKTFIGGKELPSQYQQKLNRLLFSGEAQVGVRYKVSRHLSGFAQPALRYGLNALNNNQVKWIPYAWGIGAGLNYRF